MNYIPKFVALAACATFLLIGTLEAQETNTYTNRRGDTVTDTRSLQNGQYTNDRTVTAPNGNTRTSDFTASRNSNGRVVTSDTHTGVNGKTVSSTTTHGRYGNKTTVTGSKGNSRTFYRARR